MLVSVPLSTDSAARSIGASWEEKPCMVYREIRAQPQAEADFDEFLESTFV